MPAGARTEDLEGRRMSSCILETLAYKLKK